VQQEQKRAQLWELVFQVTVQASVLLSKTYIVLSVAGKRTPGKTTAGKTTAGKTAAGKTAP
jgi:hypothetical protein